MKPGACIGSGYCCKKAPCALAAAKYTTFSHWKDGGGGCPSLVEKDGRYWCGLVLEEKDDRKKQAIIHFLAIGAGCSSTLFNEARSAMISKLRSASQSSESSSKTPQETRSGLPLTSQPDDSASATKTPRSSSRR